jgi:hypothetical protein
MARARYRQVPSSVVDVTHRASLITTGRRTATARHRQEARQGGPFAALFLICFRPSNAPRLLGAKSTTIPFSLKVFF